MTKKLTNQELLDVDPKKYDGDMIDVDFVYEKDDKARLPDIVVDTEDEDLMAEYIAKWIDDLPEIKICGH